MKMRRRVKKGWAFILALAMVLGLTPGTGTMKVAAEETGSSTVSFTATAGTQGASANEDYAMLIDGKYSATDNSEYSKWCVTGFSSAYIIFKASEPVSVKGYSIVTGNDNRTSQGRNPESWALYGCNDAAANSAAGKDSSSWEEINSVSGDLKLQDENYATYDYPLAAPTSTKYLYFKLEITAIESGTVMQMSEFILDYSTCDHNWEATGTTLAPTCTEGGYDVYKCTECGLTKNEPNGNSATGHTWVDGTEVAGTCTEDGYIPQTCSVCGAQQKAVTNYAPGHIWDENEICTVCTISNTNVTKPDGDGTENDPYKISTAGELYWFAGLVNGTLDGVSQNCSANAILKADITVNKNVLKANGELNEGDFKAWEPIGTKYYQPYEGIFDGNNHTISGLYRNSDAAYSGLFGINYGIIKNVGIEDSYIAGGASVGGVCAQNSGGGIITNCYHKGTVSGTTYVGGVCGDNIDSTVTNCYNTGTVSGTTYVGSVCGSNAGPAGQEILKNCYYLAASETDKYGGTTYKTKEQFSNGEVAYLLQGGQAEAVWGQKLGNDGDAYPVLGGAPVYRNETYAGCEDNPGEPVAIVYSNIKEDAVYAEHTDGDGDGACDFCGKRDSFAGVIQNKNYPTEIVYCNEAVTPLESNFTTNSGATPLTFTWYKGDLTKADTLPTEGDAFIGMTAPANEGIYTLVVTAPAVPGEIPYTAAELRLKIEIARAALAGSVNISGTVKIGETLTVDTSSVTNVKPGTLSYQWYRVDGDTKTAISGATNTTYTLTGDDNGKKIAVEVTAQYCTGTLEDETTTMAAKFAGTATVTSTTQSLSKGWDGAVVSIPTFTTSNNTGTENENVIFEYKKSIETEYVQTAPSAVGTYHVRVRVAEDDTHEEAVSEPVEFTISKVASTVVTAPTAATGLTYKNGENLTLIDNTGIAVTGGEIWYASGAADGVYSQELPTATEAGEYKVYYKVVGDANHNDTTPAEIVVEVEQATPDYTVPANLTANCGDKLSDVELSGGLVWTDDTDVTLEGGLTESGQTVSKTAKFVPTDTKNYKEITNIAINIKVEHTLSAEQLAGNEGAEKHASHCSACNKDFNMVACSGGTATCFEKAVCSVCGGEYGAFDPENHTGEMETVNAKEATCTEKGYTGDIYCKDCDKKMKAGTATEALGHDYVVKVTKEATTDSDGIKTYTCSRCGNSYEESIPKLKEMVTDEEIKENSMKLNKESQAGWKGNKFVVTWGIVEDAEGYDILAARCGKTMTSKSIVKTVKGQKSSTTLAKIAGKKLSDSKSYKVKIKAFKTINGKKVYIGISRVHHVAGKKNKTYTNAKKVKVSQNSVTIKQGKTSRIKATIVKQSSKKKLLDELHGPTLSYYSTDTSVATVTSKGKIKAKGKGTCYIYVTALNGVNAKVNVTVK